MMVGTDDSYSPCSVRPTGYIANVWAGVDSVWEPGNLEARKMLENAIESLTSGASFVGRFYQKRFTSLDNPQAGFLLLGEFFLPQEYKYLELCH